jgi:hypothetical protein
MNFSVFEIIMLICFGAAWPFALYRSFRARTAKGKSPLFLSLIIIGYIAGIIHKILYNPDFVIYLYSLNGVMVSADLLLYFRNRRYDKI